MSYLTPLTYSIPAIAYHLLGDAPDTPGAKRCEPFAPDCPLGFQCLDRLSNGACLGVTGDQVLRSLHAELGPIIDISDIVFKHLGIILALAAAVRLGFWVLLAWQKSWSRSILRPPSSALPLAPLDGADAMQTTAAEAGAKDVMGAPTSTPASAITLGAPAGKEGVLAGTEGVLAGTEGVLAGTEGVLAGTEGVQLVIDDVSLQLAGAAGAAGAVCEGKYLLKNVSVSCDAGEVLSIMGPSGAGKTTLLNVITCEPTPGRIDHITGSVTLNGVLLDEGILREQCAYMPQQDACLFAFLSPEAHIHYAVALYHGAMSTSQRSELTDALLLTTGLHSCKSTRAGSIDYPGLSGGQRRRLSLALALAKRPSLLIADEPTTGLDDAAAAAVMKLLCHVAVASHMAVVCTIHQPAATVFDRMNCLLLLSSARTAYCGLASDLIEYVHTLGRPVPAGVSVSEHMLNLINADFTSETEVDTVIEAWRKRAQPLPQTPLTKPMPQAPIRPPFQRVLAVLLQKMAHILLMDNGFTRDKALPLFIQSVIYGLYNVNSRDRGQEDVLSMYYASWFFVTNLTFINNPSMFSYCERWPAFRREIKTGMYGPVTYWIISTSLAALVDFFVVLPNVLPLALFMGLPASSYFGLCMLNYSLILALAAVWELSSLFGREAGTFLTMTFTVHSCFTSGCFFDREVIIWPLRVGTYILPARWTYGGTLNLVFGDEHNRFEGAYRLSAAPPEIINTTAAQKAIRYNQTFACPGENAACYADNGRDVLSALSVRTNPSPIAAFVHASFAHCSALLCAALRYDMRAASTA